MRTRFAALLIAGLMAAPAAHADTAPQSVISILMMGEGTVAGTVTRVGKTWFALSDGQQQIDVTAKGWDLSGLAEGDRVTVSGTVKRGVMKPDRVVRPDGSDIVKK
jgi:cytochrome c-type biogenesis protein CcmE